ncbi:MAG: hypothetical protein LBS26_03590 [Campylobacteraceae bacterium]|jgi:alpha-tubulin suppressor-like RCC1 family protein|nr:hypothetical protein [Campylobacteraceae bacterium]
MVVSTIKSGALALFKFKAFSLSLLLSFFLSFSLIGCGGDGGGGSSGGDDGIDMAIIAGYYHSFALSNDGKVYAAGYNEYGQLGLGDSGSETDRSNFTEVTFLSDKNITAIITGGAHSFVLSNDGKVYATGFNLIGQFGLGDNTDRNSFTEVTSISGISAIAAGDLYSFALSNDGKVYATGDNHLGQLGLGDWTDRSNFTEVTFLSDKNITAIITGNAHSFALSNDSKVYATGFNEYGQLGLGGNANRDNFTEVTFLSDKNITAIVAGYYHSFALSNDGKVYATGYNDYGQLGLGDWIDRSNFTEVTFLSDKNITAIITGGAHSFALSNDGKVYAAGYNGPGQLGLGDTTDHIDFTEVTSISGVSAIAAGGAHSFALTNDGKVYATGRNDYGQLGLSDNTDRSNFTEVGF